jgi:hypothetical protein
LTFPVKDGDLRIAILHCPLTISNRAIPAVDRRVTARSPVRPPSTIRQPRRHTFSGMDDTQTLAVRALRELLDDPDRDDWDKLVAASRALIKAIETGQSARRLADVIMIDRTAIAAAEIATLRQKLSAAEARIQIEDKDTAFNPLRERMAALNCEIAKWWSRS